MNALVVYESLWGNTAEVARAIAEGLGEGASAVATAQASTDRVLAARLLVAGAPVHMGKLPTERSRDKALERSCNPERWPDLAPPDLSAPPLADWLASLPKHADRAFGAAFDTRSMGRWTGSANTRIARALKRAGYRWVDEPLGFIVLNQDGPLFEGELDRALAWGARLAELLEDAE